MRPLAALAFLFLTSAAHATDCPPDAKSWKGITLTPDSRRRAEAAIGATINWSPVAADGSQRITIEER